MSGTAPRDHHSQFFFGEERRENEMMGEFIFLFIFFFENFQVVLEKGRENDYFFLQNNLLSEDFSFRSNPPFVCVCGTS